MVEHSIFLALYEKGKYLRFLATVALSLFLYALLFHIFLHSGKGESQLVFSYRFYRLVYASLVGYVLGVTGTMLQSSLRNPLVDHYILGIGSGAVFTAILYYILLGSFPVYGLALIAGLGGLATLFLTIMIAEVVGSSDVSYVLAGIAVASFFSGASILLSYIVASRNPFISYALTGSFVAINKSWLPILIITASIATSACIALSIPLNSLILGEEYAHQLGYSPRIVRLVTVIISGGLGATVMACCGLIGFVGLVTPHMARLFLKTSDNRLVPFLAGVYGALILMIADNFSRLVLTEMSTVGIGEVPAGAIVSLIGAPFYVVILIRRLRGRSI